MKSVLFCFLRHFNGISYSVCGVWRGGPVTKQYLTRTGSFHCYNSNTV